MFNRKKKSIEYWYEKSKALEEQIGVETEKLQLEKDRLEFEKGTKDRADISLNEYKQLVAERNDAVDEVRYWRNLFRKMGMPMLSEAKIVPDSIRTEMFCGGGTLDPLLAITRCIISFDVEGSYRYGKFGHPYDWQQNKNK